MRDFLRKYKIRLAHFLTFPMDVCPGALAWCCGFAQLLQIETEAVSQAVVEAVDEAVVGNKEEREGRETAPVSNKIDALDETSVPDIAPRTNESQEIQVAGVACSCIGSCPRSCLNRPDSELVDRKGEGRTCLLTCAQRRRTRKRRRPLPPTDIRVWLVREFRDAVNRPVWTNCGFSGDGEYVRSI